MNPKGEVVNENTNGIVTVNGHSYEDPAKQTKFENCVADVYIPVGKVFTSPKLAGTEGTLYVSRVYLNELEYTELEIHVKDGRVTEYDWANFADPSEG